MVKILTSGIWSWNRVEFAYNDSVNISISKIPFQIVYMKSLEGVVDLIQFPTFRGKEEY